jgi:hypothetical protein
LVYRDTYHLDSGLLASTTLGVANPITNQYFYNAQGALNRIRHNSFDTNFTYVNGRLSQVRIGQSLTLVTYNYTNTGSVSSIAYGNAQSVHYRYNTQGRVTSISQQANGVNPIANFSYNGQNQLSSISHPFAHSPTGTLDYNFFGQTGDINGAYHVVGRDTIAINSYGTGHNMWSAGYRVVNGAWVMQDGVQVTLNDRGLPHSLFRSRNTQSEVFNYIAYYYDSFGRNNSKTTRFHGPGIDSMFTNSLTFRSLGGDRTTNQVATQTLGAAGVGNPFRSTTFTYTYYDNGNIRDILENGIQMIHYVYDEHDRLSVEYNLYLDRVFDHYYDAGGNKTHTLTYVWTTWQHLSTDIYGFGNGFNNNGWRDQLLSFNGQNITYDAIGNPLTYRGMGMTWQNGRQLSTITGANHGGTNWGTITMQYDYNGMRTRKSRSGGINNVDQFYYWQGSRLLAEEHGG